MIKIAMGLAAFLPFLMGYLVVDRTARRGSRRRHSTGITRTVLTSLKKRAQYTSMRDLFGSGRISGA